VLGKATVRQARLLAETTSRRGCRSAGLLLWQTHEQMGGM
jgi:hypothetical protein